MTAVEVTGVKELEKSLKLLSGNIDDAIDDTVLITAFRVQAKASLLMREPSQGRAYRKSATVTHIASKEGDAPNVDEGRLIGSISVEHEKGSKVALVGTGLDYGAILELEMNRPWLEPAKNSEVQKFDSTLKKVIASQLKKAGK